VSQLPFEWDAAKDERNRRVHGVSFDEAATVLSDPLARTMSDALHSGVEERMVTLGMSEDLRVTVVIPTEREDRVR